MLNYDFRSLLEPLEFQNLICEIIQIRDQITLEIFKDGRDSGIDGRYATKDKTIIVQAKRYSQDFARLYRDLETIELAKVKKLKPQRYILATSVDLSPANKEKIMTLFKGYITTMSDILGKSDINNLLGGQGYKEVLLSYAKLWVPTIPVFEKVLKESIHSVIYKESQLKLKETIEDAKCFVPTRVYRKAMHKWEKNHTIILSGEPGVGKTTMACMLALAHLQPDNLNGFVWANSIDDIYKVLEDDKRQVFILDDFWGSFILNSVTHKNAENRLEKLIRDIESFNGEKRLLLTTREYILQQSIQMYPALGETLNKYALVCTVEEYGEDEKASILFSRLYASNIGYEYVSYLYSECDSIIYNQNYSPRTLAVFLEREPAENIAPKDYYIELLSYLDCPSDLWRSVFLDLSREAQYVAMLLLISSTPMSYDDMEVCYQKHIQNCDDKMAVKNLGECIAELEKTMIKSFYDDVTEKVVLRFIMPAIQDFLYGYVRENSEHCIPYILQCCSFYNQLQFLVEYCSKSASKKVEEMITEQYLLHFYDYEYCYMEYDGSWNFEMDIFEADDNGEIIGRFFDLLNGYKSNGNIELYQFLEREIKKYCITMTSKTAEAQYKDLHNLPDFIARCAELGIRFDGKKIIETYYQRAFGAFHYREMKQFERAFPQEYRKFHEEKHNLIVKSFKCIILGDLEFLEDLWMEIELDVLIDSIPELLKEFGLRYTKVFEREIIDVCGRIPFSKIESKAEPLEAHDDDYITPKEQKLEDIKSEAREWLLGPEETYLEDKEIIETINQSDITPKLKAKLKKVFKTRQPYYIFNLLKTKESLKLLLATLDGSDDLLEFESVFYIKMLYYIAKGDDELLKELVGFCEESLLLFIFNKEAVLRRSQLLSEEVYLSYLKDNEKLRETVFEHLLLDDGHWVRFINIPLFIFCNVCIIMNGEGSLEYLKEAFGENFDKFKKIINHHGKRVSHIYLADYGFYHFRDPQLEGCMYRMCEEINPLRFNQECVQPMLKTYLDKLGYGDDDSKVLKHILLCEVKLGYNENGEWCFSSITEGDTLCMCDHLSIIENSDAYVEKIAKSELQRLEKHKDICVKKRGEWEISVYKIKDVKILKAIGVYETTLELIKRVESVYARFLDGDYSKIGGRHEFN